MILCAHIIICNLDFFSRGGTDGVSFSWLGHDCVAPFFSHPFLCIIVAVRIENCEKFYLLSRFCFKYLLIINDFKDTFGVTMPTNILVNEHNDSPCVTCYLMNLNIVIM